MERRFGFEVEVLMNAVRDLKQKLGFKKFEAAIKTQITYIKFCTFCWQHKILPESVEKMQDQKVQLVD